MVLRYFVWVKVFYIIEDLSVIRLMTVQHSFL